MWMFVLLSQVVFLFRPLVLLYVLHAIPGGKYLHVLYCVDKCSLVDMGQQKQKKKNPHFVIVRTF